MRKHLVRLSTGLGLVGSALLLAHAGTPGPAPSPAARQSSPSLEDELARVRLEQDLMLAERTALMLDSFQEALAGWSQVEEER